MDTVGSSACHPRHELLLLLVVELLTTAILLPSLFAAVPRLWHELVGPDLLLLFFFILEVGPLLKKLHVPVRCEASLNAYARAAYSRSVIF